MQFRNLFRASGFFREFTLGGALSLDDVVCKIHGVGKELFGAFLRFAFDHDDLVFLAGVDELDFALLHLFNGRVGDELSVDVADADCADGTLVGEVGEAERGGSAEHEEGVRIMFSVIGENESVNLDFIEEAFGEERADRTVGHAHR